MPIIETCKLTKKYRMGNIEINALKDVSFSINNGEFVAVTGPSGSGKSTLLNMIGLLDSPTSGKIMIDGIDAANLDFREKTRIRLKKVGFIFQFFNLLNNLTAVENVMIPYWMAGNSKLESKMRAKELLDSVGLKERINHLPKELSGGEQQRVAIARALVNNPSVILADEPTGNLDSKTTEEIISLFEELNRGGQTIIMVTHENELRERMSREIRLVDGKIKLP